MKTVSYGVIWVCANCMSHHTNGECGDCNYADHEGVEPLSSIGERFHISAEDVSPDLYSTSWCEGCDSKLHGERYAMHLWGPDED